MTNATATTIFPPVRVEPAYADRDAVWRTIASHGPYPLMAAGAGYRELMGDMPLYPFFRTLWASDGVAIDEDTETLLHHEPFIAAGRELYGAEIVRPSNLIVNVMGPMQEGGTHVDTPTFRGLQRAVAPLWLLVVMGMSGLFDQWAVRVAGALTWFYENADGEFEYWPDGLDAPSAVERGPYGNVALVADNDLMYHHVRSIGDADAFERNVNLTLESAIHPLADGTWEIRDQESTITRLDPGDVRVSLLWKAITFADEHAASVYDQHDDDLDLDTVASVFAADLTRRGVAFDEPEDIRSDQPWAKVLTTTYMQGRT
jgi:hypothetical protein